jgi:diadenosine tetraphosphate (Ap4A) HIT family hydrolase
MKRDNCIFCKLSDYVLENQYAYAIYDINPISKGHMLIILKDHKDNIFETTIEERVALFQLIDEAKVMLDKEYEPSGYNVCMNTGADAGQTVMHVHIHLVPLFKESDMNFSNPKLSLSPEEMAQIAQHIAEKVTLS